jgi:hypothetical protein
VTSVVFSRNRRVIAAAREASAAGGEDRAGGLFGLWS